MNIQDHLHLFFTDFPSEPDAALARGREIGLGNATVCEVAAWCWELDEQVRALATRQGLNVALMGGTAVQLRLQISEQRGSRDDDYLTDATSTQIQSLMAALAQRFEALAPPYFRPEIKIPKSPIPGLALITYEVAVPALLGHTDQSGVPKHVIKLEFHMVERLPPIELVTGEVFALVKPVTSMIPTLAHQLALKIVALAQPPIGIPARRDDDIPKQIYDIDRLLHHVTSPDQWREFSRAVDETIADECRKADVPNDIPLTRAGIHARLECWANRDDPRIKQLTRDAGALAGWEMRAGIIAWACRARRIQYALGCAGQSDGRDLWNHANVEAARLSTDPGAAWRELGAMWRAERDGEPPRSLKAFPRALLFEHLAARPDSPGSP